MGDPPDLDNFTSPLRLTFGARVDDREDRIRELVQDILSLMDARPNPWANRTAAYEREWDWRR